MSNEPKTAQDYKDIVKILKLKIIKQSKRIQQLEQKLKTYQQQLNNVTLKGDEWQVTSRAIADYQQVEKQVKQKKEKEYWTLKGRTAIMTDFMKGIKKVGITPQSIFRIADFMYKDFVEADYFRSVISKMKLGLNPKQISCLVFIFDENYSGYITKEEYYNSLHAYKIGVEDSSWPFIQQSILKLSQLLFSEKVNLTKFFEEMLAKNKGQKQGKYQYIDMAIFQEQIKKYYPGKITEREVVGAFNAMDLEGEGYLEKHNFLYCITSYFNKFLNGEENYSKKSHHQIQAKSNIEYSPKKSQNFYKSNLEPNILSGLKQFIPSQPNNNSQVTPNFVGMIAKFQSQYSLNLPKIYQQLTKVAMDNRMTLNKFRKSLLNLNGKVTGEHASELFKQIDTQHKGSIYFNEMINYYLSNSSDGEMILRILGKYFARNDLNAQKFWFMFSLNPDMDVSKARFVEIMKKTFETKQEVLWQQFWGTFDKGRGVANIGHIIKIMQKYDINL